LRHKLSDHVNNSVAQAAQAKRWGNRLYEKPDLLSLKPDFLSLECTWNNRLNLSDFGKPLPDVPPHRWRASMGAEILRALL
jgi:hypothetical protein